MREPLLALFRDTTRTLAPTASQPRLPTAEPSMYLRRFLRLGALSPQLAPSGLAGLDARLAGGFGSGLHLVCGPTGIGKTAFLDSMAWEAVSNKRPVLYYVLRDGELGAWERLIRTLGFILGDSALPLDALRVHALAPHDLEMLTRLDRSLQDAVLPHLSLVGTIPAYTDTVSALIQDVRLRVREVSERHGKIPLLLVDDLEHLLPVTRPRQLPLVLSRLDEVLAADSTPGLLTMTMPDSLLLGMESLPVHSVLTLMSASGSATDTLERVDLDLQINDHTAWAGTLPLLLERRSGLFAQPPVPIEHESE
jgi:DnaB-like helicase C terminal domain